MFALAKTLPKDESGSEDERSGTSTDEDGEPLISEHVSSAVREAVLAEAGDFDWHRYDTWSVEDVAAELSLHVERWGEVPDAPLPDWTTTSASWPLGPLPRKALSAEAARSAPQPAQKKPAVAVAEKPKVVEPAVAAQPVTTAAPAPAPAPAVAVVPAAVNAPEASALPPVGAMPEVLVPELDLDSDIDYATLAVLPEIPAEAPSLQQTKQYKNYMRLRYEWQRRFPDRDLPKVVFKGPASPAMDRHKTGRDSAASGSKTPVLSRASADSPKLEKKERGLTAGKASKRLSVSSIGKKRGSKAGELPDEMQL